MELTINNETKSVPFDLALISLSDFVRYNDQYGRDLDNKLTELLTEKYEGDEDEAELKKSMAFEDHLDNEALSWFTFWTGFDLFEVRNNDFIIPLLHQYRVLRFALKESLEESYNLPVEIEWEGDTWSIQNYVVDPSSQMDFNEIITSKEVMRQIQKLGKNKWDALPYLCGVFFRKKNESFRDEFVQDGSERQKLLATLPMSYAIQVAFFLDCCVNIWKSRFQSSENQSQEIPSKS